MENIVAIDTSAIIWDNIDFENNRHHYYKLANGVKDLFDTIQDSRIKILLRQELQNEMINGFPLSQLPNEFHDVGRTFYSFFSRMVNKMISYSDNSIQNLTSQPNQVKKYFTQNIKNEVEFLLSKMHLWTDNISYITFEYLWNNNTDLKTVVNREEKVHKTIISDKNNGIQVFIESITPKFDHNPKHDCTQYNTKEKWLELESHEKNNFVSRLSCFCDKNNDKPQELLDKRYPKLINNCYYSFDDENEVYVVFRLTQENIFHAYDEYDIYRIPEEVKEHFNKEYKWYH